MDCENLPVRFTRRVSFEFLHRLTRRFASQAKPEVSGDVQPLVLVRNPRARRYVLRLRSDGTARVTIPRGGSPAGAQQFVARHRDWLERARLRLAARPAGARPWLVGTSIHFRGAKVVIELLSANAVRLGQEVVPVVDAAADLRPAMEKHLRRLATRELPPRVLDYAGQHQLQVNQITIRNQRSRWGSCSRRGTISLNWRLIQTPIFVQDYIILHELMHLREMNHSARYWREVANVCSEYPVAERWLKQHAALLR